jgi:hypothetical protein
MFIFFLLFTDAMETFISLVGPSPFGLQKERLSRLEDFFRTHSWFKEPLFIAPIAIAVNQGCSVEILRFLIDQGCGGVDKKMEKTSYTPLGIAAWAGRNDLVELLLKAGASHAKTSGDHRTPPILFAAQHLLHGKIVLESLLRHDPHQIDWTDRDGVTALRSAAKYGNLDAARVLLSHGADPTLVDKKGFTAFGMCRSDAFIPFSISRARDDIETFVQNRRRISHLLEEEDRSYLVYKGYVLSNARVVAEHDYKRDIFSILHLPEALRKRVCHKKTLPRMMYASQGFRSHPGENVILNDPPSIVQEVLHTVWTSLKCDLFREMMGYLG